MVLEGNVDPLKIGFSQPLMVLSDESQAADE
jgi:hypothetical protein